ELIPTRMTLELANRSIAYPAGIAKDVFIQVGRPFFRTARALVDVYGEELILRYGDEKLIFYADSTSKHPHKHGNKSINMINFIDISCEDRFQKVLKIKKSNHPLSGSPTPSSNPVVESLFPYLTPFGDIDLLLEKIDTFLSLDDSIPPGIDNGIYDSERYILFLEELLSDEIPRDLPPKELKDDEPSTTKSLIEKPLGIDNEIYYYEGDILFLENLLNDDPIKDLPPYELNNNPEEDILFLENLLKGEPLETERSEIYTLIREPPDTFIIGDEEIKFNPFKDIDDPVLIPNVFETPLDSFDSSLDSFDTAFTNPLFELDSEYTLNYDNPIFDIQNDCTNQRIISITVNGKAAYELNIKFLDDLHENTFSGTNGEDAWSTCNSNEVGFCNGGELLRMVRVSYMTYFQNDKWNGRASNNSDVQEEEEQHNEGRFDDNAQEPLICKVRRFEMIKYSFGHEE
ncbi:hypothetical protein Tco_1532668, partial [Tanacetum coccineum]